MTRIGALSLVLLLGGCASADGSPSAMQTPIPTATTTASPSPVTSTPSAAPTPTPVAEPVFEVVTYPLPAGSRPHDVAPAADGGIWYTGQGNGTLGWLDPETGDVDPIPLGAGSRPHAVITGPDGAAWVTDGGLNAIVRVDGETRDVEVHRLDGPMVNLNTAAFDGDDILWFTGQNGVYGRLDPETGDMELFDAPPGPYGIAAAPDGEVYFSSLASSYLGAIDRATGAVTEIETPTPGGGARRVWSDSTGALWVTEWFSGSLARYDPATAEWTEWRLPGDNPMPYAVYVDERDAVWVTDFGANAMLRFDPATEEWATFPHDSSPAEVRQLLGRPGEVWGAESAADRLIVVRETD